MINMKKMRNEILDISSIRQKFLSFPRNFLFCLFLCLSGKIDEYEKDAEFHSTHSDLEISGMWQKFLTFSSVFFDLAFSVPKRGK